MKKNKGIGVLIATAAVIALLAFTTIVGFGPKKTGAAEHIKLGLDLAGGVSITYQHKEIRLHRKQWTILSISFRSV